MLMAMDLGRWRKHLAIMSMTCWWGGVGWVGWWGEGSDRERSHGNGGMLHNCSVQGGNIKMC
jgi:hypothetical protein